MHGWIRMLSEKLETSDEGVRTKGTDRAGLVGGIRGKGKKALRRILSVQTEEAERGCLCLQGHCERRYVSPAPPCRRCAVR